MSKALFAGSFNPFTSGHLSVVEYADEIFKSLGGCAIDICITQNPSKPTQNLHLIKWITNPVFEGFGSSRVKIVDKPLLVDYMKENDYSVIVRSFRNAIDIVPELDMAVWNQSLGGAHTMFVPSDRSLDHVSSSAIRELQKLGVDMNKYLPYKIQANRWKVEKPKRIIVCGEGMGCGKSSFIKDYASKILGRTETHWHVHDMDQVVKDSLSDEVKLKFQRFFASTTVEDIYADWFIFGHRNGLDDIKEETEKLIVDYIDDYKTGIFEVSAFTAYDLQKYYDDSIIVYVKKYDSGKIREINPTMYEKTKKLQGVPIVVDFVIDDLDDNFQNTVNDIIKTYRG